MRSHRGNYQRDPELWKAFLEELQECFATLYMDLQKEHSAWPSATLNQSSCGCGRACTRPLRKKSYRALSSEEMVFHAILDTSESYSTSSSRSVAVFVQKLVGVASREKTGKLADMLRDIGPRLAQQPEVQVMTQDSLGPTGRRGLLDCAVRVNKTEGLSCKLVSTKRMRKELPELGTAPFLRPPGIEAAVDLMTIGTCSLPDCGLKIWLVLRTRTHRTREMPALLRQTTTELRFGERRPYPRMPRAKDFLGLAARLVE